MRYEIEHDIKRNSCFDALRIAEILGLDNSIITYAEKFLKNKNQDNNYTSKTEPVIGS